MAEFTKVTTYTVNCPACGNKRIVKNGKQTGQQRYLCKKCRKKFRANGKAPGRQMTPRQIGAAVRNYYMGLSYKQIGEGMAAEYGIPAPSKSTIYHWVRDYTDHASQVMKDQKAATGDVWVADEMMVDVGGKHFWHRNVMDRKTRYVLASYLSEKRDGETARTVFRQALTRAKNPPAIIITDGLPSYRRPIRELIPKAKHVVSRGIRARINNNFSERLQGTYRSRTNTLRGLDSKKTGQRYLDGWTIIYNFFREHQGIRFKRPADMAKIKSPFRRWADVVVSATKRRKANAPHAVLPFSQHRFGFRYPQRPVATAQGVFEKKGHAPPETMTLRQVQFQFQSTPRPKRERAQKGAPRSVLPLRGEQSAFPIPNLAHPAVATEEKVRRPRGLKPKFRR